MKESVAFANFHRPVSKYGMKNREKSKVGARERGAGPAPPLPLQPTHPPAWPCPFPGPLGAPGPQGPPA